MNVSSRVRRELGWRPKHPSVTDWIAKCATQP